MAAASGEPARRPPPWHNVLNAAYSPLWDAQWGLWTPKAVKEGLNTRQIDENVAFNPRGHQAEPLTGVNPATGKAAPYGSVGADINCAVIGPARPR
jgi:cell wall-associated NlpC family hydrolase